MDHQVMAWVCSEQLDIPKALGGWGLKNIFLFSKALAAKVSWRHRFRKFVDSGGSSKVHFSSFYYGLNSIGR